MKSTKIEVCLLLLSLTLTLGVLNPTPHEDEDESLCPICRKKTKPPKTYVKKRTQKIRIHSPFGKKHNEFVDIEYGNKKVISIDGDGYYYEEDYL